MAFRAHFLKVGCADCAIFEMGNDLVVIDCGYRRTGYGVSKPTNIASYLKYTIGKSWIDLMIITHPHHDHFLAMEDLITNRITVAELWASPYQRRYDDPSLSAEEMSEFLSVAKRLVPVSSSRIPVYKGQQRTFSGCLFHVLGPRQDVNSSATRECHDACLVTWVGAQANRFVICGDASDTELELVRADWNLSSATILRASHHGSMNGANLDFIKAVSPIDTIVSTESGVIQSVPHPTALQRYRDHSIKVVRTDLNGTYVVPLRSGTVG